MKLLALRLGATRNKCFHILSISLLLIASMAQIGLGQETMDGNKAVEAANREFKTPEMVAPSIDEKVFEFSDVGGKIPNYTPGARWGTQGDPLTLMQNPLPTDISVDAFQIPKGFSLSLWARESDKNWPDAKATGEQAAGLLGKPIAMNWDENGRLWISETIDYPNELKTEDGAGRDRIKVCEDTDNDGQADKFTVFAEHLSIPSTLVCYRGGVIVQDGNTTVYLKDIDGDGRADFRQHLITGWAMGDTHGGVSNFQYGPDNWIWGMQGYNNSQPVINGEPQMRFRQGFWRFKVRAGASDETAPAFAIDGDTAKPRDESSTKFDQHTIRVDALEFVRATNNNTWGLGFSEEGYVFGSTANGCPSVHMPIPNRFYDQVAGWSPETLDKISPTHQFKPIDDKIRQVDWHGGYTAGCGSAIYTARNYPQAWWNRVSMVCGPTGHLVGGFVLEKDGADYRSQNLFNVVASVDDWTAPIMAEVGPDGNVWVLDWYNYIVQHNPTPNGFQTGKGGAYESDLRDKRFGRIYRLIYGGEADQENPTSTHKLADVTNEQLVAALSDSNFFWRRTAQRLLIERQATDSKTLNQLVALVENQKQDELGLNVGAMHALWTLAGLSESSVESADAALVKATTAGFEHPSSPVRNAAVATAPAAQLASAVEMGLLQDVDPKVQLSMMLRVAELETEQVSGLDDLGSLAPAVQSDPVLLDAWTSAASTKAVNTLLAVVNNVELKAPSDALIDRVQILAEHISRSTPTSAQIEQLLAMEPNSPLAVPIWNGLARGWPRESKITLAETAQARIRDVFLGNDIPIENKAAILEVASNWSIEDLDEIVSDIQNQLFDTALDTDADRDERVTAWDQAIRLDPDNANIIEASEAFFTAQLPPSLGVEALDSLQAARVEGLAEMLLDMRSGLGPQLAGQVLTLMLARADMTENLLDAIEAGEIQFSDLQLDQRQAILNHPTESIAKRASDLMEAGGAMVASNRQALVDEWLPVIKMEGTFENGIEVFKKNCAQCHKHGEMGSEIGPNLTGMAVHPKEEILVHVLDPSRSVESNFKTYNIITLDGSVLSGMLAGESANSIRLVNSQGKEQQVLREDIDQMDSSSKSLMPEGFESSITQAEMADLLTFLTKQGRYTPIALATAATFSGANPIPSFRGPTNDKYEFEEYGVIEIEGVPFEIQDPQEGRVRNMILLQRSFGRRGRGNGRGAPQASLPDSTTVPCSGNIAAIHLLGGVSVGGFPVFKDESVSLIVRVHYDDGSSVDHELINGKHLANYQEKVDVPESSFALENKGKQLRYLKLETNKDKTMESIEFVKGEDFLTPIVMAITVESADGGH